MISEPLTIVCPKCGRACDWLVGHQCVACAGWTPRHCQPDPVETIASDALALIEEWAHRPVVGGSNYNHGLRRAKQQVAEILADAARAALKVEPEN